MQLISRTSLFSTASLSTFLLAFTLFYIILTACRIFTFISYFYIVSKCTWRKRTLMRVALHILWYGTSLSDTWSSSDVVTRYSQLIDNVTNFSQREGLNLRLDQNLIHNSPPCSSEIIHSYLLNIHIYIFGINIATQHHILLSNFSPFRTQAYFLT